MSLTAKLVALGVFLLALLAGVWKLWHTADKAGYRRAQQEYQARAELQRETNRGRARQAEEKESVRTVTITRYITRATKEVHRAAESLSACPVPADARRLLNNAARCADQDRPAACGPGDGMPAAQ